MAPARQAAGMNRAATMLVGRDRGTGGNLASRRVIAASRSGGHAPSDVRRKHRNGRCANFERKRRIRHISGSVGRRRHRWNRGEGQHTTLRRAPRQH